MVLLLVRGEKERVFQVLGASFFLSVIDMSFLFCHVATLGRNIAPCDSVLTLDSLVLGMLRFFFFNLLLITSVSFFL